MLPPIKSDEALSFYSLKFFLDRLEQGPLEIKANQSLTIQGISKLFHDYTKELKSVSLSQLIHEIRKLTLALGYAPKLNFEKEKASYYFQVTGNGVLAKCSSSWSIGLHSDRLIFRVSNLYFGMFLSSRFLLSFERQVLIFVEKNEKEKKEEFNLQSALKPPEGFGAHLEVKQHQVLKTKKSKNEKYTFTSVRVINFSFTIAFSPLTLKTKVQAEKILNVPPKIPLRLVVPDRAKIVEEYDKLILNCLQKEFPNDPVYFFFNQILFPHTVNFKWLGSPHIFCTEDSIVFSCDKGFILETISGPFIINFENRPDYLKIPAHRKVIFYNINFNLVKNWQKDLKTLHKLLDEMNDHTFEPLNGIKLTVKEDLRKKKALVILKSDKEITLKRKTK